MMNKTVDQSELFDIGHLAKYTMGDPALEREVLQMFLDQSDRYLARLRAPENTKDWHEAAHSLKGAARGIGAFRVGMRAAQLEKIAEPLQGSVRCAMLALLDGDLESTRTAILQHLQQSASAVYI